MKRHNSGPSARRNKLGKNVEQTFLCTLVHPLPSTSLLAEVPAHKQLAYTPMWTTSRSIGGKIPRNGSALAEGAVCLVSILATGSVAFLPMPSAFNAEYVNYAIGYDFLLSQAKYAKRYARICSINGFTIVSMPENDLAASLRFFAQGDSAQALVFADRAISNLASINTSSISIETEKYYRKFQKLLSLWLSVSESHEGQLAAQRALQMAQKCFTLLSGKAREQSTGGK